MTPVPSVIHAPTPYIIGITIYLSTDYTRGKCVDDVCHYMAHTCAHFIEMPTDTAIHSFPEFHV